MDSYGIVYHGAHRRGCLPSCRCQPEGKRTLELECTCPSGSRQEEGPTHTHHHRCHQLSKPLSISTTYMYRDLVPPGLGGAGVVGGGGGMGGGTWAPWPHVIYTYIQYMVPGQHYKKCASFPTFTRTGRLKHR